MTRLVYGIVSLDPPTGRRFCYGFECGCFGGLFDAAIEAFAKAVA